MILSDDELLKIWQRDPELGFRQIYDRYAGSLLRFVYRFTRNQEQAEEILQETFTELLKAERPTAPFPLKASLDLGAPKARIRLPRNRPRIKNSRRHREVSL